MVSAAATTTTATTTTTSSRRASSSSSSSKPPTDPDLLVRPSWTDAAVALAQVDKGKASGVRSALWARAWLQGHLFQLGRFLHRHAGKVLFVAVLVLSTFCVGLKSAQLHSRVDQLWVQEGGRLEQELAYTRQALGEAAASTHQLFIQTPRDADAGGSLLHPGALLAHLAAVRAASAATVTLFDITWRLKDLCYSPSVPDFEEHYIEQIFENIMPCTFISPLDCFWEGSKLLGPEPGYPVTIPVIGSNVRWTNLHPQKLVEQMKSFDFNFHFGTLEGYMKRAGISSAYQEKPCLNPLDPECPETAPNKKTGQIPDIGAELTGGCYGFAAKYMHWPEDLIVGGTVKNKTGHIKKARALQTVVQLMGERELYDFWSASYKVHHVEWTPEKAALVLDTWQRRFSEELQKYMNGDNGTSPYSMYSFSTTTLNDILSQFSELRLEKVIAGYVLMLLYAGLSLLRWSDPVRSQTGVGVAGVVLVSITVAAGLGFCALLGIAFNASTTQIVPFLALGLGVDDMFLLTHTYADQEVTNIQTDEQTGMVLKRSGLSVLLTSLSNACAFFAAALIPIPALRVFSLQAAVLMLFNLAAMLLVYPAIVSLDLRRRRAGRADVLCCCTCPQQPAFTSSCVTSDGESDRGRPRATRITPEPPPPQPRKLTAITRALPPDRQQTVTVLAAPPQATQGASTAPPSPLTSRTHHSAECWVGSREVLTVDPESGEQHSTSCPIHGCWRWSLTRAAAQHYAPFIAKTSVKVFSMVLMIFVLAGSVWGVFKVSDGLDLTDIVPQNTEEHAFLGAQEKYFGFYNMYAVTQGNFEYPNNQRLLYEYHEAFMRVPNIVKNDNGGLPDFWLSMFRDWLIELQKAFDHDWERGCITQEKWYANASDEAILAYKLLVQTGHVDNPVDKSQVRQLRLVDAEGIISPKAFYNYLSAWATNDVLAYGASQGNLRPKPRSWLHAPSDVGLKIPKSPPLTYAQMPFYLHGLGDTQSITHLIGEVRAVCEKFEERGLPNFPSGIPFLFWEQYLGLRQSLSLALACALAAVFVVVTVLLVNPRAAALITLSLAAIVLQLLGAMGMLGIKLSAIPAVLLIVAVGIGVHFTVHICLGFVTCIGSRERRTKLALEYMLAPVVHGAFATLLGVLMLAFSEFDFIVRYFFYVLFILIAVGLLNGLLFFPVLLSMIGPPAEVIPHEHTDRISTPTPPPSPAHGRSGSCRITKVAPPRRSAHCNRLHAEPSLTTITEEGNSWHSTHEIVVQPELVVETTYAPATASSSSQNSDNSSQSSTSTPTPQPHVTTKVTATAHVKVEVHTPLPSTMERECSSKSRQSRRRDSSSERDSTDKNAS
ncbi:protein patched [Schistocerca cancellata]|uniref:protein patched n=1 Tax=Schistocerca cancellata TaxID=274614 RepID=UPI00211917B8|nr:protein patched [Schistocerca cancellata]